MGNSQGFMAAMEGYSIEDIRAANKALEKWQLVQKGHSEEEAEALIIEAEEKAKMGDQHLENSLLMRLGGPGSVKWIFSDFYKRILTDPRVNFFFEGVDMSPVRGMPSRQSNFMCHIFSGTQNFDKPYRGQDLHKYMRKIHIPLIRDKGLSETHYDIVLEHLEASLNAARVNAVIISETIATVERVRPYIFKPAAGEPPGVTDPMPDYLSALHHEGDPTGPAKRVAIAVAGDVAGKVAAAGEGINKVAGQAGQAMRGFGEAATPAKLAAAAEGLANKAVIAGQDAMNKVSAAGQDALNSISATGQDAVSKLSAAGQDAATRLSAAGQDLANSMTGAGDAAGEELNKLLQRGEEDSSAPDTRVAVAEGTVRKLSAGGDSGLSKAAAQMLHQSMLHAPLPAAHPAIAPGMEGARCPFAGV